MDADEVGRVLDELGERIGPAGEYAWSLTVRQVVIDSTIGLTVGLLLIGLAVFTFVRLRINDRTRERPLGLWDCLAMAAWAAVPGTIIIGVSASTFLNPEYHAMVRLLDRLVP